MKRKRGRKTVRRRREGARFGELAVSTPGRRTRRKLSSVYAYVFMLCERACERRCSRRDGAGAGRERAERKNTLESVYPVSTSNSNVQFKLRLRLR